MADKERSLPHRPYGRLVTLPAGHLVHVQLPAEFVAALGVSPSPPAS